MTGGERQERSVVAAQKYVGIRINRSHDSRVSLINTHYTQYLRQRREGCLFCKQCLLFALQVVVFSGMCPVDWLTEINHWCFWSSIHLVNDYHGGFCSSILLALNNHLVKRPWVHWKVLYKIKLLLLCVYIHMHMLCIFLSLFSLFSFEQVGSLKAWCLALGKLK